MTGELRLCAAVLALMTFGGLTAQENSLDVGLQILGHGEVRDGGLIEPKGSGVMGTEPEEGVDHAAFVMGRTRLTINYKRPGLEAKVAGQNSGVWGSAGNQAFNLYETWVRLSAPHGWFAQIGRQALSYDDERIIGPNDWAMASRSHDVLRMGYEGHGHKAHVILAYNQNAVNVAGGSYYEGGSQPYKTMHTVWYHYDVPRVPLGASLLFMNIGMQAGEKGEDESTEYQQLLGGFVKYAPEHWSAELSYYRQMGKYEKGQIDIDAWMMAAKLQFIPAANYSFVAGYDYMSGDDQFAVPGEGQIGIIQHKTIKGFNPVYGSHHQFYGAMDFFYVSTYVNGFTPGLQNIYVGGTYKPHKNVELSAKYHYLTITSDLKDIDKPLGHEIELEASWKLAKDISLSAGYSYMKGTDTMERLKRSSERDKLSWGWLSLNVTPRLFSTKW